MIRINLLPEEYRRAERTSPKVFATMLLGVALVCSSFGWFGVVYIGDLGNAEIEEAAVSESLSGKRQRAGYHDQLVKEKREFEKRSDTIQSIGKSRIFWAEILDQVIDVVNNDGDTDRHLAWFNSINVRSGDKDRGPTVTMPGWVQGGSQGLKKVADFHEDLEHSPFFINVASKSAPSGVVEVDTQRLPPESTFFNLAWTFIPPKDWAAGDEGEGK